MNAACHLHLYDDTVEAEVDADPLTLTIKVMPPGAVVCEAEFVFYAKSLDSIRALGESIIAACDKLTPPKPPVFREAFEIEAEAAKRYGRISDADQEIINAGVEAMNRKLADNAPAEIMAAAVEMMDGMRADDAKVEKLIADADAEMIAETLDRR